MVLQAQQLQRTAGLPCPGLGNRGSPGVGLLGSLCTPHLPPLLSSGHPGIPSTADSPAGPPARASAHKSEGPGSGDKEAGIRTLWPEAGSAEGVEK